MPIFRLNRTWGAAIHDLVMTGVSLPLALILRVGDLSAVSWRLTDLLLYDGLLLAIAAVFFPISGLYRGVWRYASIADLVTLTRATSLVLLVFYVALFLLTRLVELPRSVPIIHEFVLMALLGGARFLYRLLKDRRQVAKLSAKGRQRIPVLLAGAGDEADLFIRASRSSSSVYCAIGLLCEGNGRVGRNINGVQVLGTVDEVAKVVTELGERNQRPHRLVITDSRMDGAVVRRLLDEAERLGLPMARLPRLTELKEGAEDRLDPRPIAVEDLLGRPQAVLDRASMENMVRGRRVMVTGAGGSIGSELVRQVSDFGPASLLLFDACEFNLYSIDLEIAGRHPGLARQAVLGDVRDGVRVHQVIDQNRPELVFHAAAFKHVPMVEYNPDEGVLTNAVGTRQMADACRAAGVRLMVQISTDKAVNPTNVMGASKRIGEMYTQALDLEEAGTGGTRFVTVRFGNVLGSTGSVVPLFQKQLAAGGPLTVTHPEMTRYFMTIREAVELVLQASALGLQSSAYRGKIFVLDMGEPVRIVNLARQMIHLAGLRPDVDVAITFTGPRPGEKLFEEIFHGAEPPLTTERPGILVAAPRFVDVGEMAVVLDELEATCRAHQSDRALAIVRQLVPEFSFVRTAGRIERPAQARDAFVAAQAAVG